MSSLSALSTIEKCASPPASTDMAYFPIKNIDLSKFSRDNLIIKLHRLQFLKAYYSYKVWLHYWCASDPNGRVSLSYHILPCTAHLPHNSIKPGFVHDPRCWKLDVASLTHEDMQFTKSVHVHGSNQRDCTGTVRTSLTLVTSKAV